MSSVIPNMPLKEVYANLNEIRKLKDNELLAMQGNKILRSKYHCIKNSHTKPFWDVSAIEKTFQVAQKRAAESAASGVYIAQKYRLNTRGLQEAKRLEKSMREAIEVLQQLPAKQCATCHRVPYSHPQQQEMQQIVNKYADSFTIKQTDKKEDKIGKMASSLVQRVNKKGSESNFAKSKAFWKAYEKGEAPVKKRRGTSSFTEAKKPEPPKKVVASKPVVVPEKCLNSSIPSKNKQTRGEFENVICAYVNQKMDEKNSAVRTAIRRSRSMSFTSLGDEIRALAPQCNDGVKAQAEKLEASLPEARKTKRTESSMRLFNLNVLALWDRCMGSKTSPRHDENNDIDNDEDWEIVDVLEVANKPVLTTSISCYTGLNALGADGKEAFDKELKSAISPRYRE